MKKALIVGIDHYDTKRTNLDVCALSAEKFAMLLARNETINNSAGEPNFDCKLLKSGGQNNYEKITRALLKKNCKTLFEDEEADVALFYFSGYRFDDHLGGYLATQDAEEYDEGLALSDLMIYANNSSIKEINIILDCNYKEDAPRVLNATGQFAVLRKGISILSVKNYENKETNLFADLLATALRGANSDALGNITFIDLYEQANNILSEFGHEITFRSNASRLSTIRKVIPKISHDVLVMIRLYFHTPHYKYPLDKEHIPSLKLGKDEKQKDYKNLQKMLNQGLVKPVNAYHFYYAAFNEKHCVLTERGRQYWDLIEKNRI